MNEGQYVVWQRMLNYDKEKFLEKGRTDTEKEVSMKIFDYLYKHGKEFNYYIVAKQNILDIYREYMIANQLPFNDKGIGIAVEERVCSPAIPIASVAAIERFPGCYGRPVAVRGPIRQQAGSPVITIGGRLDASSCAGCGERCCRKQRQDRHQHQKN